ncbi:M42 family metallopeptidase [Kyrpidia spormannii]|uniref:Putative enzyme n=1 Tax=Kyrpidia spormannii TaxID=2055160 RepID=A0A6F9EGU2_9BACL|nr:M42 family metallopeptidase [Kyrpidia spormannii]CAB3396156.1 putative enzyme [Kyrpidia spormannii]
MFLRRLSETPGPSGFEDQVRHVLSEELRPHARRIYTDALGNLFVETGPEQGGPRVMLAAHMDEVALMIVRIDDEGTLRFRAIGGIDERVLVSKAVRVGPAGLPGVIGSKAVHLQKPEERKRPIAIEDLYIDIGAKDADQASGRVHIGDYAVFATEYEQIGQGKAKGKAFDDRVGCAVLAELAKRSFQLPTTLVFTVQEEIGLRGAGPAAYRVNPDLAFVIEGTLCFDVPDARDEDSVTVQGRGPAISLLDRATIPPQSLIRWMAEVADARGIPYQWRRSGAGGNDAGAIHLTRRGIPTGAISVPVRYIHSPAQIVDLSDYANTIALTEALLRDLENHPDRLDGLRLANRVYPAAAPGNGPSPGVPPHPGRPGPEPPQASGEGREGNNTAAEEKGEKEP